VRWRVRAWAVMLGGGIALTFAAFALGEPWYTVALCAVTAIFAAARLRRALEGSR
jgi:hypothetical protein